MLAKRIIPCLDVTGGRVVKGVNFVELRDAGDPVEIAARYNEQGADELTFLDITATSDGRDLILPIIEAVASQVFIPLTVGGGVRTVEDVRRLLNAGADKVSFNSAAVANPQVIRDAADKYGSQCIVVPIDAKARPGGGWDVYAHGGRGEGLDGVARNCRSSMTGKAPPREVRIIGGALKRSKLPVLDKPGLRPTPDRVRETLFNWLGQDLTGSRCLDAFAGSGALGFEAASRGAAEVVLVERDAALVRSLRESQRRLSAQAVR